ncbi:MAG: hypothetical protein IPN29_02105 [Saprospiraceae bacterium]|nr:hypothetical protein [Saprospiraceae bacterium]
MLILLLLCVTASAGAFHLLCGYSTGLVAATLLILTLVLGLYVLLELVALGPWLSAQHFTSLRLLTGAIGP